MYTTIYLTALLLLVAGLIIASRINWREQTEDFTGLFKGKEGVK